MYPLLNTEFQESDVSTWWCDNINALNWMCIQILNISVYPKKGGDKFSGPWFSPTAWELLAINPFQGAIHFQKQTMSIQDTPLKINMEPKNEGLVQMIFLFKQVMFRCKILIFQGVEPAGVSLSKQTSPPNSPKNRRINLIPRPMSPLILPIHTYTTPPPKKKWLFVHIMLRKRNLQTKNIK